MIRVLIASLLALGGVAGVLAWSIGSSVDGAVFGLVPIVGLVVVGVALAGLRRGGAIRPTGAALRLLTYLALGAAVLQVARFSPFEPAAFFLLFHGAIAIGAGALLSRGRRGPAAPRLAIRVLDLVGGAALVLLVGAELGLRLFARVAPSPLFATRDLDPDDRIRCFRFQPGTVVDGDPAGARGFPGEPFDRPSGSRAIALVSDRTVGGGVSVDRGAAACATAIARDVTFWPLALDGLSTPEYRRLLESDALELGPDGVLVVLDLGDDLAELERDTGPWRTLARWLDRENVLLVVAFGRVFETAAERTRLGDAPALVGSGADAPWLADPSQEPPRMSEERLRALSLRALDANSGPRSPHLVARAIADLEAMAKLCDVRGVAFGVVILPARYQVDTELWQAIRGDAPDAARDAPRDSLRSRLAANSIRFVDLTSTLRAAQPWTDGRPHLFHRGDVRLNARGDRLVGEALAPFARDLLTGATKR